MLRSILSTRLPMHVLALIALAGAAGGCAIKTPGFGSSGLGGPTPQVLPDPAVRAPLARVQPGTQTVSPVSTRRGMVIEVKDGDTLLGLSQQHRVPLSTLISENGLRDLNVFPGMRLFVPKL